VRFWDIAATPKSASGRDPDWTAGALVAIKDGVYYLVNIVKTQSTAHDVESLIRRTADADGPGTAIVMEQEPGASGIQVLDYYRRNVLQDRNLKAYRPTGPKQSRIAIVSSHAEAGNLKLISGAWISDWLDEAELYPDGNHDDQLDAVAGAIGMLQAARGRTRIKWFGGIRK
jgi:predicted phage terminase large subunit-like protein